MKTLRILTDYVQPAATVAAPDSPVVFDYKRIGEALDAAERVLEAHDQPEAIREVAGAVRYLSMTLHDLTAGFAHGTIAVVNWPGTPQVDD